MNGKHFSGGSPIRPDVDALLQQWPHPKVGDVIAYAEVERVLGIPRKHTRFARVTKSWRKWLLKQCEVIIECERASPSINRPGAFFAADCAHVTRTTAKVFNSVGKKLRVHRTKLVVAKPETAEQRMTVDYQCRLVLSLETPVRQARMHYLPGAVAAPVRQSGTDVTPLPRAAGHP